MRELLLAGGEYNIDKAHRLFVDIVGPISLIAGRLKYIRRILNLFQDKKAILGSRWECGGGLYEDYILSRGISRTQKESDPVNILKKVTDLPTKTSWSRIAKGKMAEFFLKRVSDSDRYSTLGQSSTEGGIFAGLGLPDNGAVDQLMNLFVHKRLISV